MDLAKEVTTQDDYGWIEGTWPEYSETDINLNIVAYDFGIKKNILRLLTESVGKVDVVNAMALTTSTFPTDSVKSLRIFFLIPKS